MTGLRAHLRDEHGWTLAESVKWPPCTMEHLHERDHAERDDLAHHHLGQQAVL